MGILEIHFHDSEFVFRPSMRVGPSLGGEDVDEASEGEAASTDLRFPNDEADQDRKRTIVGAVLLLVVAGLLIRVLRDRTAS